MADSDVKKEIETLLENVEQFINDEHKIVTYEFLSQSCGIHVNLAKTVLEKYADNLKKNKKSSSYQVVYSVGGYVGKNLQFWLVKDASLEVAKSKLDEVLSVHVYSVQKGKLESFGVLYNSNLTELKKSIQQCCGQAGIVCHAAKLKPASELIKKPIVETKNVTVTTNSAQPTAVKEETNKTSTGKTENSPKESGKTTHESVNTKEKATTNKAAEKKSAGKPAISAFFAKHQVKEPTEKKPVVEDLKTQDSKEKPSSNKRVVREPSDDEIENENINSKEGKIHSNGTKRLKLASTDEKPLKPQLNKAKTKKAQKKEKQSSKKTTQRRRIQQFSDSESSGNEEEDEDIVLSSPERPAPTPMSEDDEDVLEATIVEPKNNLNKRSRKMVIKNFMDEDGFVVTTREYETCEEKETTQTTSPPKESAKTETASADVQAPAAKHPSPPGKAKQKSITSFFMRK